MIFNNKNIILKEHNECFGFDFKELKNVLMEIKK